MLAIVTGSSPVAAPISLPLDGLLLDAKLSIPQTRPGLVSRAETVEKVRSSAQRVVAISAPAGYGKSSLLSEWAASEIRPVAWLALDRFDDDPAGLLALLAAAFSRAEGLDAALVDGMRMPAAATLGRAAPRLATALRHAPRPFVFMVDDLHFLASPACHDVLSIVLAGVPDGSQFVSASRSEQPHVPRLRASDDVMEIGSRELALDTAGAMQVFQSAHVDAAPELVHELTTRTEGWPVGLHLAATIAHSNGDVPVIIDGDDRFITDYLYRESFMALPEETRVFLKRTAVLEHLSDGLCRAVTGDPLAGARLLELERNNVFLIPLDRTRALYRYHGLYREFLGSELRRTDPELIPELHARAARWYEKFGSPAMAVEHLLEAGDGAAAARLIDSIGLELYQKGELATVKRWLSFLGNRAILDYPPLGVLAGWVSTLSGETVEAERWAASLDLAAFDGEPLDGSASFSSARAMLRALMCPDGPHRMIEDAQFALASEPEWSIWRDQALYLVGEAELLLDRTDEADAHFLEAISLATRAGNADIRILSATHRALLAMPRGRWELASTLIAEALSVIDENHLDDYSISLLTFAAAARLALHTGDNKQASSQLAHAMRTRPSCTYVIPTLAVRTRIHLAMAFWSLGDATTTRYLVREVEDILIRKPLLGALAAQFDAFKALVVAAPVGARGGPPLTAAELRLLPYLQTHLTIPEIGSRLFVSRNTVSSEVGSIYRKLGVSSRSEAVDVATSAGLLGA